MLAHETAFVYPAPAALLMVPFALLPFKVSATIFALILVASIPLALRLVGVRDWRCYGLALVTAPVANAVNVDAVSPLLLLGLALVWRYRDRHGPGGVRARGARRPQAVPLAVRALVRIHPKAHDRARRGRR